MTPRRKTISIAAAAAAVSLVTGLLGGARAALAWSDSRTSKIAGDVVEPVKQELHEHLNDVKKALAPGGAMHDFKVDAEARDAWLVQATWALCKASPRASCPDPSGLFSKTKGN